ncbi:MAG: 3-dehydroquinate synthase [Verrucomicrobiota bacterium]|nr:3-dehydroquinate synthase [Verrucomicrobiota bacterium]
MRRIAISAGNSRYDALVGPGLLAASGAHAAKILPARRAAVIADEQTAPLFGEAVMASLRSNGIEPVLIRVPAGEGAKSLEQVGRITDEMAAAKLDRTSFVVALGGGVVGDVAGFSAAIYHRGIPHVQVPTTLLAQVDSSIGGKTGVNTAAGKNSLGAVHQPALVLADTDALRTLPARRFRQGFAEIIKHAIIADPTLFDLLEVFDQSRLPELVARNIEIKAAVVARDEKETSGERATLNFGHTVGHAIERAAGYGRMLHGEAIALGIVAACEVSIRRAGFANAERDQVIEALKQFDLPTRLPSDFPREQILPALHADKKFERGEVRFVVTPHLGAARLTSDVTLADIRAAIETLQ